MSTPFECIASFSDKKNYLMEDEQDEKAYVPFVVNKGMSFMFDTVMYANEANKMWQMDHKLQYDFYFHGVPKGKRFSQWQKKEAADADVQLISEYYCINNLKATKYLELLSSEQIAVIREKMNKGGRHGRT